MTTRKEHLEKAHRLLDRADLCTENGSADRARALREAAKAHTELAEAMRPTRERPTYGTTRIKR
jgi:hypothetical protein